MDRTTVSYDGRKVARTAADGETFSISIADAGTPLSEARQLCRQCGAAWGFSRDGKYVFVEVGLPAKADAVRRDRASVSLLEVATGKLTPWSADEADSVFPRGVFGGDWVLVGTQRGQDAKTRRAYVMPWRPAPVPRAEWMEITLPPNSQFGRLQPFVYTREAGGLVGRRFDARIRRLTDPFPIRYAAGSVTITPEDQFFVRGPGIGFLRRETRSSVWLMKAPPE